MTTRYWVIEQSGPLSGSVEVDGAKNAVLVIMASLLLTRGVSRLSHVPASSDVYNMIHLLEHLGADVHCDAQQKVVTVDTQHIAEYTVPSDIMQKMRASILVMGPLLARIGYAHVHMPGGCVIGKRPIDMHLRAFERLGVDVTTRDDRVCGITSYLEADRIVLGYPSVGATENAMMLAARTPGTTEIVNAALEPEVFDLITVLRKMGAFIAIDAPATVRVTGVTQLQPIEHAIIPDRLEAGTIILAAAATKGHVTIPNAPAHMMDVFLETLRDMGHSVSTGRNGWGVTLQASHEPVATSVRTMPYPGFPTDLQAPFMAAAACASGTSSIWETVYENRMLHVPRLRQFGADIAADDMRANVHGVTRLRAAHVAAPDIRGGASLVIAGLVAHGVTQVSGVHHLERGHGMLREKLCMLGASIVTREQEVMPTEAHWSGQQVLG